MNNTQLVEKNVQKIETKKTVSNIAFFIGGALILVAGLLYVLIADLYLKVRSSWLMIALIVSLASCVLFFLSAKFKENPRLAVLFKALGVALCIFFIAFMFIYLNSALNSKIEENSKEFENNLFALEVIFGNKMKTNTYITAIVPTVVGALALVAQVLNLVFGFLTRNED